MTIILDFSNPESPTHWQTVDDVVMGGRSHSVVSWVDNAEHPGFLRFSGDVSLENNGGFCSARNHGHWQLDNATELIWTLRGTHRRFLATLRDAATPDGASFRCPFTPESDQWSPIHLPLDDFRLFRRGTKLDDEARVDPTQLQSFGFLLADGQPGAFHLDLRSLRVA